MLVVMCTQIFLTLRFVAFRGPVLNLFLQNASVCESSRFCENVFKYVEEVFFFNFNFFLLSFFSGGCH